MARELNDYQRTRLDAEWAFLNATREMMNIARRSPDLTTYNQAIYLGVAIAPDVMGPHKRILHGIKESNEAQLARQKAFAESALRGRAVSPLEIIEDEINELTSQTNIAPEAELLKGRLNTLKKVRQELKPKRLSENQIIFRDQLKTDRHLPITGVGNESIEFGIDKDRVLRLSVLHPDPAEAKVGADLIYEFHDLATSTVRVAFLQYKMWGKNELRHDSRMEEQLDKLMGIGCRGQLCLSPGGDNQQRTYRFPYCSVFLRPTDRLQDPDARLISSGLHIPLCVVATSWTTTQREGKKLLCASVEGQSVSHAIFEYLFVSSLVGSREIESQELEKYYQEWGVLEDNDCIILHAQEFAR